MKKLKTPGVYHAKSNRACEKLISLLESGKANAMQELVDGKKLISIRSNSGALQATVDPRFSYQFQGWLQANGSGDGLFPGFSQTARKDPYVRTYD